MEPDSLNDGARSRTLAGRAVAQIQDLILNGEYGPGDRLRIEELAETLQMSPMPVREALQRLEALGFAEVFPHRGARVSKLSTQDMLDLYTARLPLEVLAIRRAAAVFTFKDEGRASAALDVYDRRSREGDTAAAREAHIQFHMTLYQASGSPWLVRLIKPMCENAERYRIAALPHRGSVIARRREHQAILDACVNHDADSASSLLCAHILATVRVLATELALPSYIEPPQPETGLEPAFSALRPAVPPE